MRLQHVESAPAASSPGAAWRRRVPFFYGWVVVGSLFATLAISYGVYYSFSVFLIALIEEYGWGRAPTAGVFSLFVIMMSVGGAVAGALIDRFGPSRVVPVGGVLLTFGLIATSRMSDLWQFYLYFGVICGLGLSWVGWVPTVTLVNRWFADKRGTAMGIASAGIGLGIVLSVPAVQYLISTVGWRSAYLVLAVLCLLFIVPQSACLLLGRPEELGLRPDGSGQGKVAVRRPMVVVDPEWTSRDWTVGAAAATSRFWLLGAATLLGILTNQMLWVHQAAYLVDNGYDRMLAASTVGLAGLASMPGKVLWGAMADRLGREAAFSMGSATMVLAIGLLILTGMVPVVWLVLTFALVFALGYAVSAPISPVAVADVFGGRNFGSIFGVVNLSTGFGGALGAWLAGYVFDVSGSYLVAFLVGAASSGLSAAALWLAAPRKVRRVPVRETMK